MAPKYVSTVCQLAGRGGSPGYEMLAIKARAARKGMPALVCAAMKPQPAVDKARPVQDQAGNRNPQAVKGEAKPISPSGGTTPRRNANGVRQSSCLVLSVHSKAKGRASSTAQSAQKAIAPAADTSGPKKFLAPTASGQSAPA